MFGRLRRLMESGQVRVANLSYTRLVNRLSILALGLFSTNVFFLQLKDLVLALPLVGQSSALTGLLGLAFFALYLSLLWSKAYDVYVKVFRSSLTRTRFVFSQIRFNLPIILPWLILSTVLDLIGLMPESGLRAWLEIPVRGNHLFRGLYCHTGGPVSLAHSSLVGVETPRGRTSRTLIENFCQRHGFFYKEIMLWPCTRGKP